MANSIQNLPLAFVDLETTGLNPHKHEIIEIGVVIARQTGNPEQALEVVEEFEIQVKPAHIELADPDALRVNQYHKRSWERAIPMADAAVILEQKLKGCVFIAQNVVFDCSFLQSAFHKLGKSFDNVIYYQKMDIASIAFGAKYDDPKLARYTLRELSEYFQVKNVAAHTALSDTRVAFEITNKLLSKPPHQDRLF